MKEITLTKAQKTIVLDRLEDVHDENGHFDMDIEVDGMVINAKGEVYTDGYFEDSTGAFVETHRSAYVELTAYDENGDKAELEQAIEDDANKSLNAA